MKKLGTIIISDIHCTKIFDQRKCDYILELLDRCDQVIFNGDLWSYYIQSFDDFLDSKWKQLFPALKAKKCIYIHGNHDRKKWCDSRVREFSIYNSNQYLHQQNSLEFYVTHGHLIANDSIQSERYIYLNRKLFDFNRLNRSYKFYIFINRLALLIFKEQKNSGLLKRFNQPHYDFAKKLPEKQILVAGHTHAPQFLPEKRYINCGFINFGLASFLNINQREYSLEFERYY